MDTFAVLVVILIVAIIWRGPRTLPQIGALLGRGVKEARQGAEHIRSTASDEKDGPKEG